jgi:hypothetical protein
MLLRDIKDIRNGRVVSFADADFKEEEHPRDKNGMFTNKGKGVSGRSDISAMKGRLMSAITSKGDHNLTPAEKKKYVIEKDSIGYAWKVLFKKDGQPATDILVDGVSKSVFLSKRDAKRAIVAMRGKSTEPSPKPDEPKPVPEKKPEPKEEKSDAKNIKGLAHTNISTEELIKTWDSRRKELHGNVKIQEKKLQNMPTSYSKDLVDMSEQEQINYRKQWKEAYAVLEDLHSQERSLFFDMMEVPEKDRYHKMEAVVYVGRTQDRKTQGWVNEKLDLITKYVHPNSLNSTMYMAPNSKIARYSNHVDKVSCDIGRVQRSCYSPIGGIQLSHKSKSHFIHEFGHRIEGKNKEIAEACRTWRANRTKGEEAKPLGGRYDSREVAKKDNFFNPYVGKIYPNGETEVLSMGLERIMSAPVEFYKQDKDHFALIVDIMRGKFFNPGED